MSISGRLDDVSIAEVMQFIHLGSRSGVLYVEGSGTAEIHFNSGRIVAAHGDRVLRLGEVLVRNRIISPETLLSAVERQRREGVGQVLGEVLLSMGAVTEHDLSQALQLHIQETIRDVLRWQRGTFRFEMGEVKPIQGFERSLGQLLPSVNLNTQRVLLEAARLLDEARRAAEGAVREREPSVPTEPPRGPAQTPDPVPAEAVRAEAVETLFDTESQSRGVSLPEHHTRLQSGLGEGAERVYIVSSDDVFVGLLAARLDRESIWLERRSAYTTEPIASNGSRPLILIDSRTESAEVVIEALLRQTPEATPIAIVDSSAPEDSVTSLGAVAIVDRDVDSVVTRCLALEDKRDPASRSTGASGGLLQRLRRLSSEIRTGALAANATLALLNTLADCSERSVLFAVNDDELRAIGGFGFSTLNGRPIVEVIRGLTLPVADTNALTDAVAHLEARELRFDTDPIPAEFTRLVGPSENGTAAVFPVSGTEKVILLVYTDNGRRKIEELDLMTLAADQVGVAIENEFLRYRLAHG